MKRILSMLLAVVMMIPTYPVSAAESIQMQAQEAEYEVSSEGKLETVVIEEGTDVVIDAIEYGVDPTGVKDNAEAIWRCFEAAKVASFGGTKSVTVEFPKGEYHIYKDMAQQREYHTSNTNSIENPVKYIGILIEDQKNLTIEGNGSLFVMHGNMMALAVVRSENIKLQNFSWDYAVPTVTEMTVIGMAEDYTDFYIPQCFPYKIQGNTIVWTSDVSPYTGVPYWTRTGVHENSYSVVTYQPDEEMTRIYGTGEGPFSNVTGIEQLEENKVRIHYSSRPSMQKIGMVMQFCSSAVRHTAGAFTWESKEVTAEKINVHFMDGFGWLIQMSENVFYRDCNLMPRENSGHITVSFADGIHASGAAGKIVIENCNFSHTHDDPINLHGTFTRVEERVDDSTLKLRYIHNQQGGFVQYHIGDKVQFFTRDTLESSDNEAQYEVSEIISNPGENGNDLRTMVIKFKESLPTNLSDTVDGQPKYVAENVTYAPEVEIRNCTFKNVATRGILCTTRNKVVIEDNIFYPSSMASIFLSNDSNDWYESGPIRDMTIRGNTFYVKDIGGKTSWRYASAIYVHPVTKGGGLPAAENPIHKNIMVEDNVFYMDEDAVVKAESVENFVFRNNTILRMNPDIKLSLNPETTQMNTGEVLSLNFQKSGNTNSNDIDNIFNFTKSKNVVISGNTYDDGLKRYVVADADTESTLQIKDEMLSVVKGEGEPASAAVGEVTFVNSDPEVLHVDEEGTVIGLKEGSATVYAYYEWNDTIIKSNEVTIYVKGEPASGNIIISTPSDERSDKFEIKREDQGHYELTKNSYTVDLQAGDLWTSSNTLKNLLLYDLAEIDKEDFCMMVRVEGLPVKEAEQWDTASFILYKDDDNYITVGKKSHYDGFTYVVERNGSGTEKGGDSSDNNVTSGYLGITKKGDTVTLAVKNDGGNWKEIATITEHTLGNEFKIGFGAWETYDRSRKVTFSDIKIGTSNDDFDTLENSKSVSFLKENTYEINIDELEKNPVIDTGNFLSNHAGISNISMRELGFEETSMSKNFYHMTAATDSRQAILSIIKDNESKDVQVLCGDYRKPLTLMVNDNIYTTPVEFIDGMNTFYIRVYAEDEITYKQYILGLTYTPDYVEKELSDGFLKEILFEGEDITDKFVITGDSGKRTVVKDSVQLKVTAKEGAKVTFGLEGEELPDAIDSIMEGEIKLGQGEQRVKIVITSAEEEKIYYLTIEKSSYLSDYEWISATVGYGNGVNRDANHNGSVIRLANEEGQPVEFQKGLGVHADSVIKYNISDIEYNKLQGYVGLDYCQYGAEYGDVRFMVIIDGVQVYDSGVMTNMMPMKFVDVTIPEGAELLELLVDKGDTGHIWNDHADWADMRFVKGFKVTFNSEEGSEVSTQIIEKGQTASSPEVMDKEGYTFLGWFEEGSEHAFDFTTPINSDLILIQKWSKKFPDGIWVDGICDLTYTGKKQNLDLSVFDGGKKLTLGKDYTLSYKNNQNAYTLVEGDFGFNAKKAPQVVIKMKGDYIGSKTVYFKISPVSLQENEDIVADDIYVTYTGKKQTPAPVVIWNGKKLTSKDFFVADYKDTTKDFVGKEKESTSIDLIITGQGNFTGTKVIKLIIGAKGEELSMDKMKVTGVPKKVNWNADAKTETGIILTGFKVMNGKTQLIEGTDYTVSYENNKAVGTATLVITGTANQEAAVSYHGVKRVNFIIVGTAISGLKVIGIPKAGYEYTGEAIKPVDMDGVKVMLKNDKLEKDDYSVSYEKNEDAGTATMIFTANPTKGFTGTKKVTFKIAPASVNGYTVTLVGEEVKEGNKVPYTAGGTTPNVKVTDASEKELTAGVDYTVSYKNNKAVAEAKAAKAPTVVIKGKGNYGQTAELKFTIVKKAVTETDNILTVVAKDKVENLKKNGWKQTFKIYDVNGKALTGKDYDGKGAKYYLVTAEGEEELVTNSDAKAPKGSVVKVVVTLTGNNYEGTAVGTYSILEKDHDISKATFKIANKEYTGAPVELNEKDITTAELKIGKGKTSLKLDVDYEIIGYEKNTHKGAAKAVIRGKGNYGGEKTVTFKIVTRNVKDYWWTEYINSLQSLMKF